MKLTFIGVDVGDSDHLMTLYRLIAERTPEQSISHKEIPSYFQHVVFVQSQPYKHWYLIESQDGIVGATYLSKQNEIGIFIFKAHMGKGYGTAAVKKLMMLHAGPFLANINPNNAASRAMFEKLGFKFIQVTYASA